MTMPVEQFLEIIYVEASAHSGGGGALDEHCRSGGGAKSRGR
jgi:hypothetical protein